MSRFAAGLLALAIASGVSAAPAPQQRGSVVGPPAKTARAVVTLCGLAVFMVEDSAGQSASLFAGTAIDERLARGGVEYREYELAEMYTPVASVCADIRAEHERILRERAAGSAGDAPLRGAVEH